MTANLKLVNDDYCRYLSKIDPDNFVYNTNSKHRPHCVLSKLKYKDKVYKFAIPMRSNINANSPRKTFYSLPTRYKTREGRIHGLQFNKMFPIDTSLTSKVTFSSEIYLYNKFITKNFIDIHNKAQDYLKDYENETFYKYSLDIDEMINAYNQYKNNILSH